MLLKTFGAKVFDGAAISEGGWVKDGQNEGLDDCVGHLSKLIKIKAARALCLDLHMARGIYYTVLIVVKPMGAASFDIALWCLIETARLQFGHEKWP